MLAIRLIEVTYPENAVPGKAVVYIEFPGGRYPVEVPEGITRGQKFRAQVPVAVAEPDTVADTVAEPVADTVAEPVAETETETEAETEDF